MISFGVMPLFNISIMITSVQFQNFKAFKDYSVSFKDFNILTGPNNNGKSTILDAFRILQGAYRYSVRHNPMLIRLSSRKNVSGYEIPRSSIPISIENITNNFNDEEPSVIAFRFKGERFLYLYFEESGKIYLYLETQNATPKTSKKFKEEFPLEIAVVPTLGPLEIEEQLLDEEYVKRWSGSRRSPRMFRSYWYYNKEKFHEFKNLVEKTWPEMTIELPKKENNFSRNITMFCYENRMPREVCWAGFGFQIWLQIITHLLSAKNASIIIIDEPEIYLHPDLQHKILDLLKSFNSTIILATHSVEIINNAEPSEVVLVDKNQKSAKRITDLKGLQNISSILGSGQNIQLTRLARGKKILFVEGQDIKMLKRFSKVAGCESLFELNKLTVIEINGFSNYERITHTNWAFSRILGEDIKIAALFDRDYKDEDEILEFKNKMQQDIHFVHVLHRKEIENYMICLNALQRAVNDRLKDRNIDLICDISQIIDEISNEFKNDVMSQLSAHTLRYTKKKTPNIDDATIISIKAKSFEDNWNNLDFRAKVIPGKQFFARLNERLQRDFKISITEAQIISRISKNEIDKDLIVFFEGISSIIN